MVGGREFLSRGQIVRLASGNTGVVGEILGSGGQGSVYTLDIAGRRMALKWYHPQVAAIDTTLRKRISSMVARRPPDDNFLWPSDLAEISGIASFGYVMPLVSPDRRPLADFFAAPPRGVNPGLDVRANACFDIASRFQRLHAEGYCYQDVNFGGFFVDAERGTVQICDADNIAVEGEVGGVYGTRKFMAPEVVRREAMPSTATDLYSMAVLFFYILFNWHPLDGRREAGARIVDSALEAQLYGYSPRFLFDPNSDENGPVAGTHDWVVARWAAMTDRVRALFVRAFTGGLSRVADRPVESEWRGAMAHLRDVTVTCTGCGFAHGVDRNRHMAARRCVICQDDLPLPPALLVRADPILIPPLRRIYDYQFGSAYLVADMPPLATVERHPKDATIIGLRNGAATTWSARTPEGQVIAVPPDKTVRILDGVAIDFGKHNAVIAGAADWAARKDLT